MWNEEHISWIVIVSSSKFSNCKFLLNFHTMSTFFSVALLHLSAPLPTNSRCCNKNFYLSVIFQFCFTV